MRSHWSKFLSGFSLTLSGTAIGWLVGLSASPIVHLVITSVLATSAAIVGALAGLEPPRAQDAEAKQPDHATSRFRKINPIPLALLLFGLMPGVALGLVARTHEWFGADPQRLVKQWSNVGIDKSKIAERLFDNLYPRIVAKTNEVNDKPYGKKTDKKEDEADSKITPSVHGGQLFANVPPSECTLLMAALSPEDLRRTMKGSSVAQIREFERRCKDNSSLQAAVDILICPQETTQ